MAKKKGHELSGRALAEEESKKRASKPTRAEQLIYASQRSGKGIISLGREFIRLFRGRGKLSLNEFADFDVALASDDEKDRFVSDGRHWPIVAQCCDLSYQGLTEDKWIATHFMELAGIPVPPILAVIDKSSRDYLSTQKISNVGDFRKFLEHAELPIFGKLNFGIGSFGAFIISSLNGTEITLHSGETFSIDSFLNEWIAEDAYVLQNIVKNHDDLSSFSDHLITVRIGILNRNDQILIPSACAKIPRGANFVDNFWREDNLIFSLDPTNGSIQRARKRSDGRITDCTSEDIGASIEDVHLPYWDEVIQIAERCAKLFHAAKYASLDVALTRNGPMVIEANTGGSFELFQIASGKGFLTDEVLDFFREFGVKI